MKNPEEYATELLARKGPITEFLLAHMVTRAMRDTRDACARHIEEEAEAAPNSQNFQNGMRHAAQVLRTSMVIGGPVKAFVGESEKEEIEA